MSWPFGPFTAVSGQIIGGANGIRVPQQAEQIEIENDSRMWLYVAFTNIAPKPVGGATSLDSSGFAIPIRPFGYKCIPIQQSEHGVPYQGIVWIQAADRTSVLANAGNISQTADVFVTALAKGETPTLVTTLPRQTDMTSQPRVITLNVPPPASLAGQNALTTAGNYFDVATQLTLWSGSPVLPNTDIMKLWYFITTLVSTAAAGSVADLSLRMIQQNISGTVLFSTDVLRWYQRAGDLFAPPLGEAGVNLSFSPFSGAVAFIRLAIFANNFSAAGTWTINACYGAALDFYSNLEIPTYGQGSIFGNPALPW